MQIYVTQKLAKAAELPVVEEDTRADPLFSWIAGWFTAYGKTEQEDTLIAINKAARFVVAIYPVTKKDFPGIFDRLSEAIRHTLQEENCNPALIEKYLAELSDVKFVKNSGRENSTRLNRIARLVKSHFPADLVWDLDGGTCDVIGFRINRIIERVISSEEKEKEKFPAQSLGEALAAHYGLPRCHTDALEIECTLDLERYLCIRRIVVPADLPLSRLHWVLQYVFNWFDCHLHLFHAGSRDGGTNFVQTQEDLQEYNDVLEEGYTAEDLFPRRRTHAFYVYDFGDDWTVDLHLVKRIKGYEKELPRQLLAEGAAPPEDCGGVWGFEDLLDVFSNPEDPEYHDMVEWADGWTPEIPDYLKGEIVIPMR